MFYPKQDITFGGWGFDVCFDIKTALTLRDIPIKTDLAERLQQGGREIISGFGLDKFQKIRLPYSFVEDSCLLRGVNVPGDACDLGLAESEINDYVSNFQSYKKSITEHINEGGKVIPIRYTPHNVDTQLQASALLSLWLNWANTIVYTIPGHP